MWVVAGCGQDLPGARSLAGRRPRAYVSSRCQDRDKRNTEPSMPKTVETYRTTKALRDLVRKAARLEGKRPSEFLRQAAEEKARTVIAARAREDLRAMLDRLPPGRAADDAEAERVGEAVARTARSRAR